MKPTSEQPKRKRKGIILIIVIVLIVVFVFPGVDFGGISENMKRSIALSTLLNAIEKKDGDKIKNLFSEGVINEVGDESLERGIEYLFEVFQGKVLSKKEFNTSREGTTDDYKKRRIIRTSYIVTTDIDVYRIYFVYHTKDAITPEFLGMFQLIIQKEDTHYTLRRDFMGIYVPNIVDENEKNSSHEFINDYGTFIIPAGFYKDVSLSGDNKYYFTTENVVLSDIIYSYFSISFKQSDFSSNEIADFERHVLSFLNEALKGNREINDNSYPSDSIIEENVIGETKNGYPFVVYSIVRGASIVEKFYFVLGEKKYMIVHLSFIPSSFGRDLNSDELSMISAIESLVDSFMWAK